MMNGLTMGIIRENLRRVMVFRGMERARNLLALYGAKRLSEVPIDDLPDLNQQCLAILNSQISNQRSAISDS